MTFDEAINKLETQTIGNYEMQEILENLRDIYAPTIEMTQAQYDIFNSALAESKENKNDFIYFIDNLDTQSHFYSDIFGKELSAFINDSRYLMQAWLHPETIKVVDNDI